MVDIPIISNSVYVSMVQTGCCQNEFDSTYPVHLNGIIDQGEFVEAIKKINRTILKTRTRLAICIIYLLSIFISVLIIVYGDARTVEVRTILGGSLSMVGTIVFLILLFVMQYQQVRQMREAVAEESRKYSARSHTPCSWRLETTGFFAGWGNNNSQVTYRLIIDIGRTTVAPGSTYGSNQYAPPPYSSSSAVFCSKCGATRSDLSAGFCSSCGQAFNKC